MTVCIIVRCERTATVAGMCPDCHDYYRIELANDKYRTDPPPSSVGWKAPYRGPQQPGLFEVKE